MWVVFSGKHLKKKPDAHFSESDTLGNAKKK
jgi:hypothetical protein